MIKAFKCQFLKSLLLSSEVYALFDVRERHEFERGHIYGATQVSRSFLEFRITKQAPVKDTMIILYDNKGCRALMAADTLKRHGYTNLAYLEGGLNLWKKEGYQIVKGLNVPSKAFGELIAIREKVPQIPPAELMLWIEGGENVVIIEVRPKEEVQRTKGSIPGSINAEGVELPIKIFDLIKSSEKIVVTCAGRTRGIIAAQTLRLMGFKDVYDLMNGTMGWILAGYKLQREIPLSSQPSKEAKEKAKNFVDRLSIEYKIPYTTIDEFGSFKKNKGETVYLFDVRTREEYETGHIPDAISLPGGQAIQCADDNVPVRRAKIIFVSNYYTRAAITAFWYMQMGFRYIYVLEGGINAWKEYGLKIEYRDKNYFPLGFETIYNKVNKIDTITLKKMIDKDANIAIIDVDSITYFTSGHIPKAEWLPRSWLEFKIKNRYPNKEKPLIITCHDGIVSTLAANTLGEIGYRNVFMLEGGNNAWRKANLLLETGRHGIKEQLDNEVLKPYEQGHREMLEYLDWEKKLGDSFTRMGWP